MSAIEFVSTGNQWEQRFGYARVARAGNLVLVGGTVALNPDGTPHAPGDAGAQTARCFDIIETALRRIGLDRTAILRSRVFVTNIADAERVGLAHRAFFGTHTPCLTQVGVAALVAPAFVVEIECEAYA